MSAVVSPICVRTIDHVTLVVADLDRSRQFYVGTLGMREVPRPNFNFPGLWFQAGNTQIHLILQHAGSGPSGWGDVPQTKSAGRVGHFAFEVDDAIAALEFLQQHTQAVRGGPNRRPDGCVQVFLNDPDGHVVELFSRPESAPGS